jgi:uncharacterized protein YjbI with pentapeptide repeats
LFSVADIWKLLDRAGHLLKSLDLHSLRGDDFMGFHATCPEPPSFVGMKFPKLETLALPCICRGFIALLRMAGPELKTLIIDGAVTEEELEGLDLKFSKLETLILTDVKDHARLADRGIIALLRMAGPDLKALHLDGADFTEEELERLDLKFSKLETLILTDAKDHTDRGIITLLRMAGPDLKTLHLDVADFTEEELEGLDLKFSKLETLILTDAKDHTDRCPMVLLQMAGPDLKTLRMEIATTGEELAGHDLKFPKLQTLILRSCWELRDNGLCNLLDICGPELEQLDVSHISGSALCDWIERNPLPKLSQLELAGCEVTRTDFQGLSNMLPDCKITVGCLGW